MFSISNIFRNGNDKHIGYMKSGWTREEYLAYLLIFCMKSNFHQEEKEEAFILNRVGEKVYKAILEEFRRDNEYHRAQKIQQGYQELNYSLEERQTLFREIENLFKSDGYFDAVEQSNFYTLKRLLHD